MTPRTLAAVALAALALASRPAHAPAQELPIVPTETIRGRVLDDSSRALAAATVIVTRGPDRLVQQGTTDSLGGFSITFTQGTGDYLVHVSAPGFAAARRRVQRQGTERELVANFTLGRDIATLAAVNIRGERPARATNTVRPTELEPGSSERWRDGVEGQLPPTVAGDLNALATNMPGVTLTPNGPSILGAGPESNLTTLNGMGLAAGQIPRAARTETRVTGATFDPTRGGFAGANIDVRLGPGDRFFQRRNGFVTLDAPQLSFTDAVGRSLGAQSGGFRGSLGADGELIRRALTYNVAVDVARNQSDPATLLDADEATLLRAGISPDSVVRLVDLAGPLGVALVGGEVPGLRRRDAITWLGRLDDTRDTLSTRALTTYAGFTKDGALGFGPLSSPSAGGERRERTLGAQLTLGSYVGEGRRTLVETRFAASQVSTATTPYLALPGATVLVRSPTLDERSDVTSVSLGGNPFLNGDERRWTLEGANETFFNARGRRHRFKTQLWGRMDGLSLEGGGNRLGTYTFASIDDFADGRASSFTRTLEQPDRSGTVWNGAAAIAHGWYPSRFFNMLYGARLEANGFADAPPGNPALEQALGVRTGLAPARIHVSPRVGFSYTYSRSRENGSGTNQTPVGRFYRTTSGVVRGGIGEFRDLLRPGLLADASANTGLAGGTTTLSCVGSAVPVPDWDAFDADPSAIPTTCADGSGLLAERAPSATLIGEDYDVPRSWRASLDWTTNIFQRLMLKVNALGSWDLSQPGTIDANFAGTPRFSLASEGGRPVFVSPSSIDPLSGSVSAAESRRSDAFGRVGVRTSDLRGYGGLLTVNLAPDVFSRGGRPWSLHYGVAYTLQRTLRQFRGFDGAGFGDPSEVEWASGPNDARHAVVLQGGFSASKTGTVTLFARTQSGLPFTPIVSGDPNGDGRFGDRAFIPAAGDASDPALAEGIAELLANGSSAARACIEENRGRVVARNGCRGPWTQSLNVQWRPPIPRKWTGRLTTNVYLQNVLGGIDQMVNGGDGLKGWGGARTPDPVLLVPRGFDAQARRFRYDVNQRFADTRAARTTLREPFRVVIDFSLNLSTNFDVQQLRRALEPVKTPTGWEQRSADSLASFYLSRTSSIHKAVLQESDSLFLSAAQMAGLRRADSVYSERVRALFVPLGRFLSERRGHVPGKIELDSVTATQKLYWKVFWEQPEVADSLVTPTQRELFPMLKNMVAVPKRDRENSQWQFGSPVLLVDRPRQTSR